MSLTHPVPVELFVRGRKLGESRRSHQLPTLLLAAAGKTERGLQKPQDMQQNLQEITEAPQRPVEGAHGDLRRLQEVVQRQMGLFHPGDLRWHL